MKKFLLIFLLMLFAAFSLQISVYAEAEQPTSPTYEETTPTSPTEEETDATLSGAVLVFLEQNGDDICQYLSLGLSVVLAWLFKKGVLPSLSGSMGNISKTLDGGIAALKEQGESLAGYTKSSLKDFSEAIAPALENFSRITQNATDTEEKLKALEAELEAAKKDRRRANAQLQAQMDLFYAFFMGTNLPQYQKDRLGECYARFSKTAEAEDVTEA